MPREELMEAFASRRGPSPLAICPSPLAASPNDLRTDTNIHAPASAARFRGKVSLRADLVHASYASCNFSKMVNVRGRFSLRGELMHAFVSYRVATEGPAGNGLSGLVAQKIRGIWPKGAKEPVPFRPEEAKCYLARKEPRPITPEGTCSP
ncbi:hypothetical protein T484DRAFT_1919181 [Baffinella frigidus]|nr:hypothetical protein T484DRAFT_1919181 [Cryptophyta sp. CCMP2293]